ncbi:acyl-CoA synthetase [Natrinema gelatinilyticum]|uniref:acyl-CoA synthetase n=1 Tax=Natrinema gelatinilyticum TaxID=2961571 RepID=UPI0020C31BB2|nr:AMP-binding protein [Natrinema gelatinilyticum]
MADVPQLDAYHFYEQDWDSYDQLQADFEWEIPEQFNMADYVCDRWADDDSRVAMYAEDTGGNERTYTYQRMRNITNQLANYFAEQGIKPGDRVGVNVPQKAEAALAHIAIWKLGAVSIPLSVLFGPDGLRFRLDSSSAKACVVDEDNIDTFREVKGDLENIDTSLTVGDIEPVGDEKDFWNVIEDQPQKFDTHPTKPDDNAIIIYTSGTTGDPKGVLHGHRFLLGQLPCFLTTFSAMDVKDDDVYWMPMEWAWVGIFNMVFCPFYYGRPVVAYERREFVPEKAFEIIEKYGVTSFLSVPTALRMMQKKDHVAEKYDVSSVRVVPSGGEEVGQSIVDWAAETFDGATIQKAYGQTEANIIIGDCTELMEYREGKMGRAAPGHEVEIVDPETAEVVEEPGEPGEIAVRYENDPVCFKEYWNEPEKTDRKRKNGWHLMEDLGTKDEDGYFGFVSRKDDVILCSGYRVGPEEVEESVVNHDAVADCGVIGIPHDTRGQVPKAFVVLNEGYEHTDELKTGLQEYVKQNLAKYEYPREIEFMDDLPKNPVGKLRRTDLRDREGVTQVF